jgi:hypothetical protein
MLTKKQPAAAASGLFPLYGVQPGTVGMPGEALGRELKSAGAGPISVPFT